MSESSNEAEEARWGTPLLRQIAPFQQRENQIFLLLTLAIGALTGFHRADVYRDTRSLRSSRHGHGLRRYRACSHDLRADDL